MSLSFHTSIDDPNLLTAVEQLIVAHPESKPVIQRLIAYFDARAGIPSDEEREHKKRKTDMTWNVNMDASEAAAILDVSVQLPARKRYNLVLTMTHLFLINPKTNDYEYSYGLHDFELGACVPIPGAAKGDAYALFLKTPDKDPVVFNIQQKGPLLIRQDGVESTIEADKRDSVVNLLTSKLGIRITVPDKQIYRSSLVSSSTGKPSEEDKFHANAYLKAKEGSLYFLPRGILYGFKKPTVFFPFSCIASTHYCGIMQHTFNIALVLHKGQRPLGSTFASSPSSSKDDEEITVEFSMIEQSEYSGIDAYIKTTGINDKSMSEELRAPEVKTKNAESSTQFTTQELNDDDEEENDDDFHPSDDDEDPLEYDSEAESSDNMEAVDDDDDGGDDDENHKERLGDDDDEEDLEHTSENELIEGASEQDVLVSEDEEEQDITRTDNETEDDQELGEEELEDEEELVDFEEDEEEDEEEDDDRSESLGSSSDQDIDEDMHDASIGDDAKDELDDSD